MGGRWEPTPVRHGLSTSRRWLDSAIELPASSRAQIYCAASIGDYYSYWIRRANHSLWQEFNTLNTGSSSSSSFPRNVVHSGGEKPPPFCRFLACRPPTKACLSPFCGPFGFAFMGRGLRGFLPFPWKKRASAFPAFMASSENASLGS